MSLAGNLQDMITAVFHREFGSAPTQLFSAPGRVNLIGDRECEFVCLRLDRSNFRVYRSQNSRNFSIQEVIYRVH